MATETGIPPDGLLLSDGTFQLPNGLILKYVHRPDTCKGPNCVIHNPSDHPLRQFPLHWRGDIGLMERICTHGVGHPDPDHLAWDPREGMGIHGCCGCCAPKQRKRVMVLLEVELDIPHDWMPTPHGSFYTPGGPEYIPVIGLLNTHTDIIAAAEHDIEAQGVRIQEYHSTTIQPVDPVHGT
jgi:hypothetical protein